MATSAPSGFKTKDISPDPTTNRQGEPKEFTGDGSEFLNVPGCKAVYSVFIGHQEVQPEIVQQIPIDPDAKNHYTHKTPVYQLVDPGPSAYLTRVIQSNDGRWQGGATITVFGDWDTSKE